MYDPYMSQISMFGFGFPPRGWAGCYGQTLAISNNQALFSLLGNTFGGDARTTFMLPNLSGRVPIHRSAAMALGANAGAETVTLSPQQMPSHTHTLAASGANASSNDPTGSLLAVTVAPDPQIYGPAVNLTAMDSRSLALAGQGAAHTNLQPSLVINFCISLQGVFPSRN